MPQDPRPKTAQMLNERSGSLYPQTHQSLQTIETGASSALLFGESLSPLLAPWLRRALCYDSCHVHYVCKYMHMYMHVRSRVSLQFSQQPSQASHPSKLLQGWCSSASSSSYLSTFFWNCRAQSRNPPPPHTDENDGDDAEDNDVDVLVACYYSECDCWEHHCSYAVLPLIAACSLLLSVSMLVWLDGLS